MANEMIFKNKASNYSAGRPSYAPEMIEKILNDILPENGVVADIGSGTGILTKEFVQNGYETYAVEPNPDMRKKAEKNLSNNAHFHSIDASAECTGLSEKSISLITAASAFHWFDAEKFKQECVRILNDDGVVCIISNVRIYDDFFISRCLSSSYAPLPDSDNYTSYVDAIKNLLEETFKENVFRIASKSVMFVGRVSGLLH